MIYDRFQHELNGAMMDDRRLASRLQTSFAAELASGTVVVPVVVQDLSVMGCGIEIQGGDADLPDKLGQGGILHFPSSEDGAPATIMPAVLRNVRCEGLRLVYGLEFRPLYRDQMHKLVEVIEAIAQEEVEEIP